MISPYRAIRDEARKMSQGQLRRGLLLDPDRGLRAARRQGDVRQGPRRASPRASRWASPASTTPTSRPSNPEVTLDTGKLSVQQCVDAIIDKLLAMGYILPHGHIAE